MHVVAILHCYPPRHNAGAEWMIHTLFRSLIEAGHTVDVTLTAQCGEEYELDGITIKPFKHKSDPSIAVQNADVLVTHLENTPRTTALGRMFNIPVVHILHNTFEPSKRWLAEDTALAVFNSSWMQQDYIEWIIARELDVPPNIVIHPPVIAADYATTPGDHVTMINMTEAKGALIFWELARSMPDVSFLAVIGGYGEQVIPDNAPRNVVVHSHVPGYSMKSIYGQTKILLMPSEYESWGRVGVEAMASGIPVIASPTRGLIESLGPEGIFVERDDFTGWEENIRYLLDGRRRRIASRKALARSAELDPTKDLARWVDAMEVLHARYSSRHRSTAGSGSYS